MINDRTITGEYFEFGVGGQANTEQNTHVALHIIEADGTRTTLALPARDAEVVGKVLAHSDFVAGRPPRDW
jgi:hypothetical protein